MILAFPDFDTFRLALTGGFAPADATLAPAAVSFDPAGRIFLDTTAKLPKKVVDDLKRLGVTTEKRHPADPQPVACWPQVIPVEKNATPPQLSSQAAVLFDLPLAGEFAGFVAEILRLGNDRQSFRRLSDEDGSRVLLRVIGPPYYTLLRALDRHGDSEVRAYVEQAPRVWVEAGYSHPLADSVKVADDQLLLIRPPRDWRFLPDAPFRDVYEALNFTLPSAPTAWQDAPVASKITVPLKLVPGNAADAPEMWVLRGPAADQLDAFVRDADERIARRLKFAVGTDPVGNQVVVLRTTASKQPPPVLPLADAIGYKPFWKIPNLYVPAGTRLHPQLRRDAIRKLLADDADQLVWLSPGPAGAFTPEALPEDSFRPLDDWVDYVIEANAAPLAAWVEATRFGFEGFVCTENPPPKPKDDKGPPKGRKPETTSDPAPPAPARPVESKDAAPAPTAFAPEPVAVKPRGEWVVRRQSLEDRFLAADGPLDAPERQALWPELAAANAGAGDATEAGICWANALWEPATPPAEWLDGWLRAELPDVPRPIPPAACDKLLSLTDPTPDEARQFAALVIAAAHSNPQSKWLADRLPAIQRHLEAHEAKLPVRAAWLAAHRLARLTGADVLGLARVRDRLLQRLLEEGLNPERNLPHFLRFAGSADSARIRLVRDKALELHGLVRAWTEKGTTAATLLAQSDGGATLGYIDLLFAFALAKLGETTAAKSFVKSAERVLTTGKPDDARAIAGGFLLKAYGYRVDRVLEGKPARGPLPPELHGELAAIPPKKSNGSGQMAPGDRAYYAIARLREQSRVLEPQERVNPYRHIIATHQGEAAKAVLELPGIHDPQILARKIRDLYRAAKAKSDGVGTPFFVLLNALPFAARAGEAFTAEMLAAVPEVLGGKPTAAGLPPPTDEQGQLLERALVLAGHFDRRDLIGPLVEQFALLVRGKTGDQRYDLINAAAAQSVRSLRRFGMADEIDDLLQRLHAELLVSQTPAQFRAKLAGKPDFAKAFQSLLALAGGWLGYGLTDRAEPTLNDARDYLLSREAAKLSAKDYAALAQAYIAALGGGPVEFALPRVAEFFQRTDPARVTNAWTTAPCYSRFHLNVAEEVVLALAGDEVALGPNGRRWLEEDEYLIRRRIHRDMKRHLEGGW